MIWRLLKDAPRKKAKRRSKIDWTKAPDVEERIQRIITSLSLEHIRFDRIYCFRSQNANTRAYARIWGLGRIWQEALGLNPAYILEVIGEKFDKLGQDDQNKVLIHELVHIPNNFSGSLVPHIRRGPRSFERLVSNLVAQYNKQGR